MKFKAAQRTLDLNLAFSIRQRCSKIWSELPSSCMALAKVSLSCLSRATSWHPYRQSQGAEEDQPFSNRLKKNSSSDENVSTRIPETRSSSTFQLFQLFISLYPERKSDQLLLLFSPAFQNMLGSHFNIPLGNAESFFLTVWAGAAVHMSSCKSHSPLPQSRYQGPLH